MSGIETVTLYRYADQTLSSEEVAYAGKTECAGEYVRLDDLVATLVRVEQFIQEARHQHGEGNSDEIAGWQSATRFIEREVRNRRVAATREQSADGKTSDAPPSRGGINQDVPAPDTHPESTP